MVPGLPPGPDTQGFASTAVPPVIPATVASIRGRTNSLVIIEFKIKKKRPFRVSDIYVLSLCFIFRKLYLITSWGNQG
jgi:hypothetical protein